MNCRETKSRLLNYLDGDLNDLQTQSFEEHIKSCAGCKGQLKLYKTMLNGAATLKKRRAPDSLWNSIEAELDHTVPFASRVSKTVSDFFTSLAEKLHLPAPVLPLAGAVALLVIGIFIGGYLFPTRQSPPEVTSENRNPQLELISRRTDAFLEKSKILFLGIVNADPDYVDDRDWSSEKKLAQNLIKEASFLRDSFSEVQNYRLRTLVEELEVILLEIANLEEEYDIENIEIIKSGIDQKGLMLKINIHDMQEDDLLFGKRRKTRAL